MFILSVPRDVREGKSRVNGQDAEFRVEGTHFDWRHIGQTEWTHHYIASVERNDAHDTYTCAEQAEGASDSSKVKDQL
jgi:hypothetical protein